MKASRKTLALGAAGCFLGVAALWVFVTYVGTFPGDRAAKAAADNGPLVGLDLQLVTFMGNLAVEAVALVSVTIACVAVWSALGAREAIWILGASAGVLVNDVVKAILGPTPAAIDGMQPNFPSGHVVYLTVFGGSLAWLAWTRRQREAFVVCASLVLAMGPARIFAGAHVVSDVVGGYLFGLGWLLTVAAVGRWGTSGRFRAP